MGKMRKMRNRRRMKRMKKFKKFKLKKLKKLTTLKKLNKLKKVKSKEVEIVKEVIACDVSPVAMFCPNNESLSFGMFQKRCSGKKLPGKDDSVHTPVLSVEPLPSLNCYCVCFGSDRNWMPLFSPIPVKVICNASMVYIAKKINYSTMYIRRQACSSLILYLSMSTKKLQILRRQCCLYIRDFQKIYIYIC